MIADQLVKQPSFAGPVVCPARVRRHSLIQAPSKNPRERSAGRRTVASPRLVARGALRLKRTPRLPALHLRRSPRATAWLSPGSALPGTWRGVTRMPPVPVQQAPCRAVVVPPCRVPGRSSVWSRTTPARTAPSPAFMTSHDNALGRKGWMEARKAASKDQGI